MLACGCKGNLRKEQFLLIWWTPELSIHWDCLYIEWHFLHTVYRSNFTSPINCFVLYIELGRYFTPILLYFPIMQKKSCKETQKVAYNYIRKSKSHSHEHTIQIARLRELLRASSLTSIQSGACMSQRSSCSPSCQTSISGSDSDWSIHDYKMDQCKIASDQTSIIIPEAWLISYVLKSDGGGESPSNWISIVHWVGDGGGDSSSLDKFVVSSSILDIHWDLSYKWYTSYTIIMVLAS